MSPRAVDVSVLTGLLASLVLSTFPSPTMDLVMPATVPVNVGLASGALAASAAVSKVRWVDYN